MALCALRSSIRVGTLCQDQLRGGESGEICVRRGKFICTAHFNNEAIQRASRETDGSIEAYGEKNN